MAKKPAGLLVRDKRRVGKGKHMPDRQIDFSDIPQSSTKELSRARRVGRPRTGNAKQLIAIRIDPKLLKMLRRLASKKRVPYQSFMHEILESSVKRLMV